MMLALIATEALGQVIGALVAAVLFCWLCWKAFKFVRHPELSAVLCLALLLAVWGFGIDSPLLKLTSVYAALFALWLWPAGRSWRRQRPLGHRR